MYTTVVGTGVCSVTVLELTKLKVCIYSSLYNANINSILLFLLQMSINTLILHIPMSTLIDNSLRTAIIHTAQALVVQSVNLVHFLR